MKKQKDSVFLERIVEIVFIVSVAYVIVNFHFEVLFK